MSAKDSTVYNVVPQTEGASVGLKPKMTLINGCSVIVGSIIGSGIFVSPTGVLANTGSVNLALIVWTFCGVFSMIGAYCYAELGCMITKTGADYAYIMESFGPFVAFVRLWIEAMIVRPCATAIVALTFAVYVLRPMFLTCEAPDVSVRLLAAALICFLTFVNCQSMKWATRIQDWFTYAKLVALFIIIITGIVQLCRGHTQNFTFENTETDVTKVALSLYSGLFAYNGWNYLNFVIEELKDPVKNLPKAIYISCILVTVVYVMTNVAFYTTLTTFEVLGSEAVAVTFADRLYGVMSWVIPVFVALSTFGAVNGVLMTSSRLFYAGAREGQMPEILTMIQTDKMTPTPSVIFMGLLSLLYLSSSNINALITYVGFATWLAIGLSVACLPYLRWKQPKLPRPIRVNLFFPFFYIICTIFITVLPMIAKPVETGFGLLIVLTGVPVYFIFVYWKNKPLFVEKALAACTLAMQKMLVVVGPEK
jgi:L-type amino acid transporter 8